MTQQANVFARKSIKLKLIINCYNHKTDESIPQVEPIEMWNVSGQGDNLQQSGLYRCPKCKAEIYAEANGCIAHLVAISKQSVVINMNHEIGKEGNQINIVKCECPNCRGKN